MVISLVNICTGGGFRNFATLTNTIYIMKRFLLFIVTIPILTFLGCSKDDDARTAQTILVHLKNSDDKLITLNVENTAVFFFEDNGKQIDYTVSNPSLNDGKLTYIDGTTSMQAKITGSGKAVYTFENIPNGKYILWVHYFPFSFGTQSSKQLIVSEGSHLKIETKIFRSSNKYEEW